MCALAGVLLIATGFAGWGRIGPEPFGLHDFVYLYSAGAAWLRGMNPYELEQLRAAAPESPVLPAGRRDQMLVLGFVYPPTASGPAAALALLPAGAARYAFAAINVLSLAAVVGVCALVAGGSARVRSSAYRVAVVGIVLAAGIGSPFVSHNIWMGQSSLLVAGALCGAYLAQRRGRPLAWGALGALATIKPGLGLFYYASAALDRRWRALAAMMIASAILAGVALAQAGPVTWGTRWLESVGEYGSSPHNQPGFRHSFGIRGVLYTAGLAVPSLAIVGLGLFAVLWWGRRRFTAFEVFALCLAISLLFVHAHDYDLVAALPLLTAALIRASGSPARLVAVCAAIAAMYVPLRFAQLVDAPLLWRYREVLLLGLCGWLVLDAVREREVPERGGGRAGAEDAAPPAAAG